MRPDAQTGLVREVWVQELRINEQPLLPEQLTRWVELGAVAGSRARSFHPLPQLGYGASSQRAWPLRAARSAQGERPGRRAPRLCLIADRASRL